MHRIIKNTFILLLSIGLLSLFSILTVLWAFSNTLPDYKFLKNYKPSVSSKVYSGDGELVNDFSTEKRIFVPYKSCLLYTSPSPRDGLLSRMPSSA